MEDIYENMLSEETYSIIGACMDVHRELGCGFLEAVYQEALEKEFLMRSVPFDREADIGIFYKGKALKKNYIADFICFGEIIVELKALQALDSIDEAQILNYLKASNLYIGLLINFGQSSLKQKRLLNKHYKSI